MLTSMTMEARVVVWNKNSNSLTLCLDSIFTYTPLKFNMEPEHGPLEKEIPFWKPSCSGSMLNFVGVYTYIYIYYR